MLVDRESGAQFGEDSEHRTASAIDQQEVDIRTDSHQLEGPITKLLSWTLPQDVQERLSHATVSTTGVLHGTDEGS